MHDAGLYLAMSHPIVVAIIGGGLIAISRIGYSRRGEMICFGASYLLYSLAMVLQVWPLTAPYAVNAGLSATIYLSAVLVFCGALASVSDQAYPWGATIALVIVAIVFRICLVYAQSSGAIVMVTLHAAASVLFLHAVWLSRKLRRGFWADRLLWFTLLVFSVSMVPRLLWVMQYKSGTYGFDWTAFWVVTHITFTVFLLLVAMSLMASVMQRRLLLERELSEVDFLTGLLNRRGLSLKARASLKRAHCYALIMIDMDHFKRINDSYGHVVGDQVLMQAAELIRSQVRPGDLSARLGGEEFVVIMPDSDLGQARVVAQQLQQAFERASFGAGRISLKCTASMGVASFAGHVFLRQSLPFVDELLYDAKKSGRNTITVFPDVVIDPGRLR